MKRLCWFLVIVIILMLASPVFAQSKTYYHEVTMEFDGEFTYVSDFVTPDMSSNVALNGTGKASIHSITKDQSVPVWWDLF